MDPSKLAVSPKTHNTDVTAATAMKLSNHQQDPSREALEENDDLYFFEGKCTTTQLGGRCDQDAMPSSNLCKSCYESKNRGAGPVVRPSLAKKCPPKSEEEIEIEGDATTQIRTGRTALQTRLASYQHQHFLIHRPSHTILHP